MNKIKFGIMLPSRGTNFNVIREISLESESLGYHSVWLPDHLIGFGVKPILECWTTLSALSTLTKRIRLGPLVSAIAFRNPSVLAKMGATLDVISNGRLEFGVGIGNNEYEHIAYGIPFPKPKDRVYRMKEGVEIIKKMWTEDSSSYKGKHYEIKDAFCEPKPLQKPHPPITIGGKGEKITLKVIAELADKWNYNGPPQLYKRKLDVLEKYCNEIGRSFRDIEKTWFGFLTIAKNKQELRRKIELQRPRPEDASYEAYKEYEKRTSNIVGTPEECMTRLQEYVDMGVTYFIPGWGFRATPSIEDLRLFIDAAKQYYG